MRIEMKEALERSETVNDAFKLIDESLFNDRMSDPWFKERLGEVYEKLLVPDGWYVRAQKGDFEVMYNSIYPLGKPFKEKVEEIKAKSFRSRMLRLRRQIRKEVDKKLKSAFINEYKNRVYLLFEDGTAKSLRIGEKMVTSKMCPVIENLIVTGEMSIDDGKVFYEVMGKKEDIFKVAEKIQGIARVSIIPKEEYRKKVIDAVIPMMDIPEPIKPMLLDNGLEPYGEGLKKGNIGVSWSKQYITLSNNTRYERIKFTSPNFEQKFKRLIIELSI
jgi:polyhydroxyalkanoate synthesis regulator phasin